MYAEDQISQTLSDQFQEYARHKKQQTLLSQQISLSKITSIKNTVQRHFYEIEAAQNHWSGKNFNANLTVHCMKVLQSTETKIKSCNWHLKDVHKKARGYIKSPPLYIQIERLEQCSISSLPLHSAVQQCKNRTAFVPPQQQIILGNLERLAFGNFFEVYRRILSLL